MARLEAIVAEVDAARLAPEARLRRLIGAFLAVYARSQAEHRVLTDNVRFLDAPERDPILAAERRVVAAFASAIVATRPELGAARLEKPLAMLLFGMMNWMFTWLQPGGALSHDDLAPVVADLFFGGVGAVRPPRPRSQASPLDNNGDFPCSSPASSADAPSSPSASPRRPRSRPRLGPTSPSA